MKKEVNEVKKEVVKVLNKEQRYIRADRLGKFLKDGWKEAKTTYDDMNLSDASKKNLLKDRDLILVEK